MPITKSAKKALRVATEKKSANDRVKKAMKEKIKDVEKSIRDKKGDSATLVKEAFSAIDKAAKNGVIKKNTANRRKAKVSKMVK